MRILRSRFKSVVIARNPDTPSGTGTRAAVAVGLLDDQDTLPSQLVTAQGRCEATISRADHKHIHFMLPRCRLRRASVVSHA